MSSGSQSADAILAAIGAARIYDLGRDLSQWTPTSPGHMPFRMALRRRHGDFVRMDGGSGANDIFTASGHTGTHIDALCHVSSGGRLFGGVDAYEASRGGLFKEHGAERIPPLVRCGVLLDVPASLNVSSLEPGRPVTADDLTRTCRHQQTEIGRGDVVLVRTGWPVGRYPAPDGDTVTGKLPDPTAYIGLESGVPGPDETAARWLADKGIVATGADTIAYEWLAPRAAFSRLPVHLLLLVEHGIFIMEVLDLEDLARDSVFRFLFVAVPLKLVGLTGSPIRPLAVAI